MSLFDDVPDCEEMDRETDAHQAFMTKVGATVGVALALAVLVVIFAGCQKPLPVNHPEQWEPGYGATDYPNDPILGADYADAGRE